MTGGFGKWHMTPGREMGPAGPFDHWPLGWGFDHWWGFLTGAAGQYDPIITQDNSVLGVARGRRRQALLLPRRHHRQVGRVAARDPGPRRHQAVVPVLLHGLQPRPAPCRQGVGRQVQGPVRRRLGRLPREDPRTPEAPRRRPGGHRALRAPRTVPGLGLAGRRREAALRPPDGGVRRVLGERRLERRAAPRRGRGDGRAGQHPHHLHLGRQRRQHGGHDHRLVQRDDVLQRRRARGRGAARAHREVRRHRGARRLPHRATLRGCVGPRQQHPVPSGGSRWPATSVATGTRWSSPGRTRIAAGGDLRSQFTHCIDIAPTILDSIGIPEPTTVDGIAQEPMDGTSFAYTFDDARGRGTPHHPVLRDVRQPRHLPGRLVGVRPARQGPVGLPAGDVAAVRPGAVRPERTIVGAVLPARRLQPGARTSRRSTPRSWPSCRRCSGRRPSATGCCRCSAGSRSFFGDLPPMPTVTRYTYAGDVQNVSTTVLPRIYGRSYSIEADLHVPEGGAEGVLCAFADFIGGFALWVDENGHLVHTYQYLGVDTYKQVSTEPIPTGDVTVKMLFEADEPKPGSRVDTSPSGRTTSRSAKAELDKTVVDAVHDLRRHGHGTRQRRRRRPRLRGQGAVRLHRQP